MISLQIAHLRVLHLCAHGRPPPPPRPWCFTTTEETQKPDWYVPKDQIKRPMHEPCDSHPKAIQQTECHSGHKQREPEGPIGYIKVGIAQCCIETNATHALMYPDPFANVCKYPGNAHKEDNLEDSTRQFARIERVHNVRHLAPLSMSIMVAMTLMLI